jgi:hypothetical protein
MAIKNNQGKLERLAPQAEGIFEQGAVAALAVERHQQGHASSRLILACVLAFSALSVASCGNSDSKKNNADTGVIGGVDGASLETGGLEVAKGVDSGSGRRGVDAGVGVDVGVVTIDSGPAIGLEVGSEAGVAVDTQIPDMNTTLPDGPTVRLDGSSVLPDGSSSVLPDAPIAPDALIVNIDAGIDSSAPSVDGGIDSTTTPLGPTSTITNTSTNTNTVTSSNTVTNSNTSTSSTHGDQLQYCRLAPTR